MRRRLELLGVVLFVLGGLFLSVWLQRAFILWVVDGIR